MALNTPYERIRPEQLAKINQEDPWFGLGYLLANAYNTAYDKRGIDKGLKAGEDIINKSLPQDEKTNEELYQNAKNAGLLNIDSNSLAQRNSPYGNSGYKQQAMDSVMPKQGAGESGQKTDTSAPLGPSKEQLKQDKRSYFVNKYANSPNPDSDATQAQSFATAATQTLSRLNSLQGFDKTNVRNQIMQKLIDDGRPLSQRNAIMEQLNPILDAKEKSVNDELFQMYNNIYQDQISKGNYDAAQSLVANMVKYNPTLASASVAGNPTRKDVFAENNKRDNLAIAQGNRKEMAQINFENTKDLMRAKSALQSELNDEKMQRTYMAYKQLYPNVDDATLMAMIYAGIKPGEGKSSGPSDSTKINAAKIILEDAGNWRKSNDTPYPYADLEESARKTIGQYTGFGGYDQPDIDNYNQMDDFVTQARAAGKDRGMSDEQIVTALRKQFGYGRSGYLEQVLKDRMLVK